MDLKTLEENSIEISGVVYFINEVYLALFSFRSDFPFKGSKPRVLYICN